MGLLLLKVLLVRLCFLIFVLDCNFSRSSDFSFSFINAHYFKGKVFLKCISFGWSQLLLFFLNQTKRKGPGPDVWRYFLEDKKYILSSYSLPECLVCPAGLRHTFWDVSVMFMFPVTRVQSLKFTFNTEQLPPPPPPVTLFHSVPLLTVLTFAHLLMLLCLRWTLLKRITGAPSCVEMNI